MQQADDDEEHQATNLSVCAGCSSTGVYISRVEEGSVAQRAGLRPGDVILEVNGTPFSGLSHEDALKVGAVVAWASWCRRWIAPGAVQTPPGLHCRSVCSPF